MPNNFQLPLVKKGEPGTLLDADRANQLIGVVNKLANLRVIIDPTTEPGGSKLQLSDTDAVIIVGTRR